MGGGGGEVWTWEPRSEVAKMCPAMKDDNVEHSVGKMGFYLIYSQLQARSDSPHP